VGEGKVNVGAQLAAGGSSSEELATALRLRRAISRHDSACDQGRSALQGMI